MVLKELTGQELINVIKEELKKSAEKGKIIKIPCVHGTIVWVFDPSDLLKWLDVEYEIFAKRSFCEFIVLNNKTKRALLYEEKREEEVFTKVTPLSDSQLTEYLNKNMHYITNNREEIIKIMISNLICNWFKEKIFGQSYRVTTNVYFP